MDLVGTDGLRLVVPRADEVRLKHLGREEETYMIQTLRYGNGNRLAYSDFGNRQGFPLLIQHGLIASIREEDLFGSLIENGRREISATPVSVSLLRR